MDVDVVIVGDGPAGCSAALTLLGNGYSVALVSKPSTMEKPTETAAPRLKSLLESIGAESALKACSPCFGISSDWGRNSSILEPSMLNPFGHSWFIHRRRFDSCLRELVLRAGGICVTATAHGIDFSASPLVLRLKTEVIRAQWLIMATGSPSW